MMLDTRSAAAVAGAIRRERLSLLAYMADAVPWGTEKQGPDVQALLDVSRAVGDAAGSLGRFLMKRRITPPMTGSYPTYFTYCNFLAVDWLLPRLIAAEQASLATLDGDVRATPDADAKQLLAALAEVKRTGLARLEALAARPAAA